MERIAERENELKHLETYNSETNQLYDKLQTNETKLRKEAEKLQDKGVQGRLMCCNFLESNFIHLNINFRCCNKH